MYEHRGLWLDWNANHWRTKLLLKDEELPPKQFQTMRNIQRYNNRMIRELKQEEVRRCRQARLDFEQEAKEERERVTSEAEEKQQQHQAVEIVETAHGKTLKKANGIKRLAWNSNAFGHASIRPRAPVRHLQLDRHGEYFQRISSSHPKMSHVV